MSSRRGGRPAKPIASIEPEIVSTIRMSPMEIARLRRELEAASPADSSVHRVFSRWPLTWTHVRMEVQHPGGATTTLNYVPRNLSRDGIGLIHSAFVYPGTRCIVHMPHQTRGNVALSGTLVRCRHFRGTIHELGVRFDQAIDVREHVGPEVTDDFYTLENVHPEKLTGSLLLLEPNEMDRALIRRHLKDTNLTVTSVASIDEAASRCTEGYDLILGASELPGSDGLQLLRAVRDAGSHAPFIMLCGPTLADSVRLGMANMRPDGLLAKPVAEAALLSALGEFLLVRAKDLGAGGAAIMSTLSSRDPLAPHVPEYIRELRQLADRLAMAINSGDLDECRRLAFQISGSATTFGFAPIAETAKVAAAAIKSAHCPGEPIAPLRSLAAACYRAQAKRSAA